MRSVDDSEKGSDDGRMCHRQHESIYFLVTVRSSMLLQSDGPLVKLDRGVPVARKLWFRYVIRNIENTRNVI